MYNSMHSIVLNTGEPNRQDIACVLRKLPVLWMMKNTKEQTLFDGEILLSKWCIYMIDYWVLIK